MQSAKCCAPPSFKSSRSTEVITTYFKFRFFTVSAKCSGSLISKALGRPCETSQNGQRRVQISPIIMNVAVPLPKHCGKLGQAASSQTVCSFCCLNKSLMIWTSSGRLILVRIHSGFFGIVSVGTTLIGIRAIFLAPRSFFPVNTGLFKSISNTPSFKIINIEPDIK